jgi:hypothetical protein
LQLAQNLPYKFIIKHADKAVHTEALLLGQAGFLEETINDSYVQVLQREYRLLRSKFGLERGQLNPSQWRLLRLRPANFPALRLAQFAALLHHRKNIFSALLHAGEYASFHSLFSVEQSNYWRKHYQVGVPSKKELHGLGGASIDNLIINTAVPLLAAWSRYRDDQSCMDRALLILQQIKTEVNQVTSRWKELSVKSRSAADSQGLLELYHHFCSTRRCLDCTVGAYLVRPE